MAACLQGQIGTVGKLLDKGANPNCCSEFTPILAALSHIDVIHLLLERGANPDAPDARGVTALVASCEKGLLSIVDALLRAGANIELRGQGSDDKNMTPLFAACANDQVATFDLLIARGASIWTPSQCGALPLFIASFYGSECLIEKILRLGADPNKPADDGARPLHAGAPRPQAHPRRQARPYITATYLPATYPAPISAAVPP